MKKAGAKTILIIANGQLPYKEAFLKIVKEVNCIIAVDGGSNICYTYNISPHYIIGDLDSVESEIYEHFHDVKIIHRKDQNRHDMDKGLEFAQSLNPERIWVLGAFGKRLDHSIANLLVLQSSQINCPIKFIDEYGELSLITGSNKLNCTIGHTISLFSFLPIQGLSLEGFKYPVKNKNFPEGFNGVSNITISKHPKIIIKSGSLFIYIIHENISA
jgi:thiamine pyrophosphokinase